tara:strand:+ start:321 stop:3284 length:2964 start_codon:yes stop_codon:yes gene_type:complete
LKNKFKNLVFLIIFIFSHHSLFSQLKDAFNYDFGDNIINISSKEYSIYVQKEEGLFTVNNRTIYKSKKIKSFCISGLGNEILIVEETKIGLFKIEEQLKKVNEVKYDIDIPIQKIIVDTYGREYYILFSNGNLYKISSDELKLEKISGINSITDVAWSKNINAIYAITSNKIIIIENEKIKSSISLKEVPNSLSILDNTYEVAVGFESGNISILSQNLKQLNLKTKISDTKITSITPHLEDPHIFIGDDLGYIYSLNTISNKIDKLKTEHQNKISLSSIFSKTKSKINEYILSHSNGKSIKIWNALKFEPNYKELVQSVLEKFKIRFFKLKPNELEKDFLTRTNSKISSRIFELEKQKIIDSLAMEINNGKRAIKVVGDNLILEVEPFEKVSVNNTKGLINSYLKISEIHFDIDNLNSFYVKDFKIENQIDNSLIVYNPILDEKIKDSLAKTALFEKEKERKAIELAQQISKQEQKLKKNLTSLVQSLKENGKINQVDLSVNSQLVKERDSTGNEELNLKIAFISKGVKAVVGAKTSDYPPGEYNLLSSPSAKTLVEFFLKSMDENLSEHLTAGTRVTFRITGSTDKSRIAGSIPYDGEFGKFKNFPFYYQGSLNGINLNQNKGISENSELGFLRTYSVRDFIENFTDLFDGTKNKFIHYSEESDKIGPEYRKIKIEITIHSIDKLMGLKKGNEISLSEVDIDIPKSTRKVNGYALIIGNEDYASYQTDLDVSQNVPFAAQDAESFKNYLNVMYGIPKENIIFLINATYGEMSQSIAKFKKLMEFDGEDNNFIFYYSGHGMPDENTNDPYIMPVDISGYTVNQAISLNNLLSDFSKADYNSCSLFIDACFSGVSRSPEPLIKVKGVGKWKIKKTKSTTRSFYDFDLITVPDNDMSDFVNTNIGKKMVLFSSSSGDETSLTDEKNQHGLFTFHLLKKLKDSKGKVTTDDLFKYIKNKVGVESIMNFNKQQTPEILYGEEVNKDSLIFN